MTTARDHDGTYRKLFDDPVILGEFLEHLVDREIIRDLNLSTLQPVETTFLGEALVRRVADKLWKVRLLSEPTQHIFVLLEFQSSVDRRMPARIMNYIGLLYQDLLGHKQQEPLPWVLPIVLYNGEGPWTAPLFLRELVKPLPPPSDEHLMVRASFDLVDIHRLSTQHLEDMSSVLGLFFRIERFQKLEHFPPLVDALIEKIKEERYASSRQNIALWLNELLRARGYILTPSHINSLLEVKVMIAERLDKILKKELGEARQKGMQQGMQQGMQEGIQEGIQEGHSKAMEDYLAQRRSLFLKQLSLKFGDDLVTKEKREARVADLSLAQLDVLSLAIMTADTEGKLDY